ncbi:YdeI/OmpD-associated family protein [Deinococcus sp.]|uniref:YdeI/OmpD-associated family protein n=1 Tax=Deinococcus sp. TaxID=47478 RepID=UPI003CC6B3C9
MIPSNDFEHVEVASTSELRDWLGARHTQHKGIWLVRYKKHVTEKYVSAQQVLDELLCFGWIDGSARKIDDDRTKQYVSPRRTHHWARSYKERAERLIAEGRMHAAGLAAIEESRSRGLWNVLDDVDDLVMPDDLVQALAAQTSATVHFAAFPDPAKRFALRWIKLAKSPEARVRRIEKTARLAEQNLKVPGS